MVRKAEVRLRLRRIHMSEVSPLALLLAETETETTHCWHSMPCWALTCPSLYRSHQLKGLGAVAEGSGWHGRREPTHHASYQPGNGTGCAVSLLHNRANFSTICFFVFLFLLFYYIKFHAETAHDTRLALK